MFDGHAGIDAAVYSAAHLHQYMIQNPQYETNPEAALKHAFHITDTNFIKKASKEVSLSCVFMCTQKWLLRLKAKLFLNSLDVSEGIVTNTWTI